MSDVYIFEHVLEAIQNHADSFKEQEIYGWLLGYDNYEKLFVISSIPCYHYRMQSQISAEPSHEEVMEITKAIPKGIGVVGIYHSHTGKVFHSKTDDQTIEQFATIYPYFLSIVTNVSETKYYQFKENSVNEINVGKIKKEDLVLSNFETSVSFDVEKKGERILTHVSTFFY
jgi:proteasome lid subunit RPN8/RPN11